MTHRIIAFFGIAAALGPASAEVRAADGVEVVCAGGRGFWMRPDAERATVEIEGRQILLERQPLPIGAYYRNRQAALVIDGDFVAFVPRGDTGWRDCRVKSSRQTVQ